MFDNLASATGPDQGRQAQGLRRDDAAARAVAAGRADDGGKRACLGFDVSTWFGVFAPAGTPAPIVARLNESFTAALRTPEMRERLARMGAEPAPMPSEQFAQLIKAELAKYGKVVKFSGARVD